MQSVIISSGTRGGSRSDGGKSVGRGGLWWKGP